MEKKNYKTKRYPKEITLNTIFIFGKLSFFLKADNNFSNIKIAHSILKCIFILGRHKEGSLIIMIKFVRNVSDDKNARNACLPQLLSV